MATDSGYERGNYLRVCDICGHRFHFRDLKPIGELRFACPDDAPGLTAMQISRYNARAKPLVVKPNKWAKDYSQTGIYQLAEAQIFNFIAKVAPALVPDGSNDPLAAAWAAIYMADLVVQNKRPLYWNRTALTTISRCLTYLLTLQYGSPTGTAGTADNPRYGGILSSSNYSTKVTIAAGVAFLKAFAATGNTGYRDAAERCAIFLRHVQCGNLQASAYTVYPSGGGAYHIGGLASGVVDSTGLLATTYLIADVAALWFLALLAEVRPSTTTYGDAAATAFFTQATAASIATMMSELTTFAETGPMDSATGVTTPGLSTTAPRATYTAAVNGGTGGATWASIQTIPSDDIALALLGLYSANGNDAKVQAMMAWLAAFTSNANNRTPANMSEADVLAGITGTYNPAIAPATALTTSAPFTEADQALYSWSSEGLLAPILSGTTPTAYRTSKDAVSTSRRYSFYDITNLWLGPLGGSGLSYQPRTRSSLILGTTSGQLPVTTFSGATILNGIPSTGLVQLTRGDLGLEVAATRVSAWRDQSSMHQDWVQLTVANNPYSLSTLDGIPTLSFGVAGDANKALVTAATFKNRTGVAMDGASARTVMAVIRPRFDAAWGITGGQIWNHSNWQALFDLENTFTSNGAYAWSRAWRNPATAMEFTPIAGGAGGPYNGAPVLVEYRSDGSPNLEFRLNNTLVALSPTTMPGVAGAAAAASLSVDAAIAFLGEVAMVAVYDWAIDSTTRGAAVSAIGRTFGSLGLTDTLTSVGGVVAAAKTGMMYRYDPGRYPAARGN